nr:hypothetical protein CFP56_53322 [Quercus suber]
MRSSNRIKAMLISFVLGGLSQPLGAGVAALWFKIAGNGDWAPSEGVYGGMFAVTADTLRPLCNCGLLHSWTDRAAKESCVFELVKKKRAIGLVKIYMRQPRQHHSMAWTDQEPGAFNKHIQRYQHAHSRSQSWNFPRFQRRTSVLESTATCVYRSEPSPCAGRPFTGTYADTKRSSTVSACCVRKRTTSALAPI